MGGINKAERLMQIASLLQLKPRKVADLAGRFKVSKRTIQRDLEALSHHYEVEKKGRGLYEIRPPSASLTPLEALALFTAGRLLYHHAPTRHYESALLKLAQKLPETIRSLLLQSASDLESRQGETRTLEMVVRALLEGRVLSFEYRSGGSRNWRRKEVLVYFLEVSRMNLSLYAIGYERTYHKRILTFKISRMRNPRLLAETYTVPPDFDPRAYLTRAWGIVGVPPGKGVRVVLRFLPEGAWRVKEGGYPGLEILEEAADGSLKVALEAAPFKGGVPWEVLSWIQSFGPRVEVLSPPRLRELWLEEARRVLELASQPVASAG